MKPTSDPTMLIGALALAGFGVALCWRIFLWIRDCPVHPDPWEKEFTVQVDAPEAVQVCPHCLTEQTARDYFCPKCGAATGPYNNLMPWVYVFSAGEVLRNGTSGNFRVNFLTLTGYAIIPLAFSVFLFFAMGHYLWHRSILDYIVLGYLIITPLYVFQLFKNLKRLKSAPPPADPVEIPKQTGP